jgi:hypothetical protein
MPTWGKVVVALVVLLAVAYALASVFLVETIQTGFAG